MSFFSVSPRLTRWLYLACLLLIGLVYAGAGALKVFGAPQMVRNMDAIGYGTGWRIFIGVTELLGVAALVMPSLRSLSLLLLLPYAIGGLAVHVSHGHPFWQRDVEAALMMVLIPVALWLDPHFRVQLYR